MHCNIGNTLTETTKDTVATTVSAGAVEVTPVAYTSAISNCSNRMERRELTS